MSLFPLLLSGAAAASPADQAGAADELPHTVSGSKQAPFGAAGEHVTFPPASRPHDTRTQ